MSRNPFLSLVSDPEVRSMRIESVSVYPRSINDHTNGGSCHFVLPRKGYMSSDARLVLPATCLEPGYQYPPNAGVFSLIDSATLSTASSGVFAQVSANAGELYANLNMLTPPERKLNVDATIHDITYVMETGSGSKLNAQKSDAEKLAGQYRLICDEYKGEYPSTKVKGRKNCRPNWLNGTNSLKLETDASKTPQYSVAIGDLFPGLFQQSFQLPLGLIQEEILLDINFSRNGELGNNDRAVFCPSLSTQTASSVTSVAVHTEGEGTVADVKKIVLSNPTGSANGSGLKLMCDLDGNGKTKNISIIDGGKGYAESEVLVFTHASLDTTDLRVVPAYNFVTWDADTNFWVDTANQGAGYVNGDTYEVTNPANSDLNFNIVATAVNAGALESCELASVEDNNNMCFNSDYDTPYEVEGGAKIYVVKNILTITNTADNGAFAIGDLIQDENDADNQAIVITIDGNNRPTTLHAIKGTFADGDSLEQVADNTIKCGLNAITDDEEPFNTVGLGLDPVFNFDNNNESEGKINIDTANVFLTTDLIFYQDGKMERDMAQMMNGGINVNYTQFINVKSDFTDAATEVADYGAKQTQTENRLIGFSNCVLRSLMFNLYNSGTVPGDATSDLPYAGQKKTNALLNKYHSRGSLVKDGFRFNLNINSIPYYSSQVETDLRMFRELNKCHGKFYVNKGLYQSWPQARQDKWSAVLTDAAPSGQPGFTDLDANTTPTLQYEVNDRKAAIVNQGWNGISQKWLRGMGHYNGVSFKMSEQNVQGNGVAVGSQQVDLTVEYDSTYDPYYSGTGTLSLFGEVERRMSIHKGVVAVTTASY